MQALNKTKATMQGRQCRLTFVQLSSQDTTAAGHVNNYGKIPVFMGVANNFCSVSVLTFLPSGGSGRFPQIEVIKEIKCLQVNAPAFPHIRGGVQSFGKAAGIELQICNSGAQTPDLALAHFFSSLLETAEAKPADNARVISFGFRLVGLISRCRWRKLRIIFSEMKPPERPELSSFSAGGSSSSNGQRFKCHSFESAARCFLWRRLISPSSAETTNCPMLSSDCLKLSTSAAIERGTLTSNLFDFVLIDFVAIAELPFKWCPTIIIEKKVVAKLDVSDTYKYALSDTSEFPQVQKQRNPEVFAALTGSLTKTLTGVTNMAEQQHTQTRPKYQYRFMALDRADMAAKPCRLSVEAETEQDARRILAPHFILSLAARLPVVEVSHA